MPDSEQRRHRSRGTPTKNAIAQARSGTTGNSAVSGRAAALICGFLASIPSSHEPAGAHLRDACRTIELPPMISGRLMVRSPIFEIDPSRYLPPVECKLTQSTQMAEIEVERLRHTVLI